MFDDKVALGCVEGSAMPDGSYTLKDALAAERAAVEAASAAEKLLEAGAWFAYAEAYALAKMCRQTADRIRARVGRRAIAA